MGSFNVIRVCHTLYNIFTLCMEFKIDYNNDYVTDLPTDDPPAIVNALCGKDIPKKLEHRILMVLKLQ